MAGRENEVLSGTVSRSGSDVPRAVSHAELGGDLRTVTDSLHRQFDDRLGPETVTSEIQFVADRFAGAPIRAFVPLLVRRYATEELTHRLTWP